MLEVFIFINPLEVDTFDISEGIKQIKHNRNQKLHVRLVPLLNLKIVNDFLASDNSLPKPKSQHSYFNDAYKLSLDSKAAEFQGGKKGRMFLTEGAKLLKKNLYNQVEIHKLLRNLDIEETAFEVDRNSELVKKSFQSDQKLAQAMNVSSSPSAVVTNHSLPKEYDSILVEEVASINDLRETFDELSNISTKVGPINDSFLHLI